MVVLIILPNTLFNLKYYPKDITEIIIYEHPFYFTKYKFNKKKLILHRASMKYYMDYVSKKYTTKYVNFNVKLIFSKTKKYYTFDPVDSVSFSSKVNKIESPNFLLTIDDYTKYRKKTDKFSFTGFYRYGKKIIDIIPNINSTDKQNRRKPNKPIELILPKPSATDLKYIKPAISYVEKNFKGNYGNSNNFIWPVTHSSAKRYLKHFIKHKFNAFGDYQDYIDSTNPYNNHSLLSSSINIGLLNPLEIIEEIRPLTKIKMNSYEGYIRQLFWREYQRFTYIYYFSIKKHRDAVYYKTNNKKITNHWYNGSTGIKILDDTIVRAFDTAYLHHIDRLMLVGNIMRLYGIKPLDGFKWFMEFSIDSYPWVMYQNVLSMVYFTDAGKTMTRAYIASSNYLKKMSNYTDKKSFEQIDALYQKFKEKNKINVYGFKK